MENLIIKIPDEEDIKAMIDSHFDQRIQELKYLLVEKEEQVFNRIQASKFLGISSPTLDKFTQNGSVKGYRLNGRPAYKKSDLLNSLEEIETLKYHRS